MPLDPSLVTNCHTFPDPLPSSVTYFTDGPQSADQFCNKYNRRSTFGPLGSGRLPKTSGDQMPAQNFTCQHNSASRRKNQSAARQSFTKLKYLHSIRDI